MSRNNKVEIKNPYPGIRSFRIEENHLFFGRKKQTNELLEILNKTHFVAITGASGSGKSSLVKAGLIPDLIKDSSEWNYISFRPGNEPFKNMASSLFKMLIENKYEKKKIGTINNLASSFQKNKDAISIFLNDIGFNKKILLYIDQFEELFRFRDDEYKPESKKEAELFVNIFLSATNNLKIPIYVIITLRSDFLGDCTNFVGLAEKINQGHYLIPKMTLQEKVESLIGPATISKIKISEKLVQLIKNHLTEYNVSLPILQHSLMKTWDYWFLNAEQDSPVTEEHYKAIGTISDALTVHAETIYNSFDDEKYREITKKVFKALTFLGEDNRGTRNPTRLGEICKITHSYETDVISVIEKFRAEGNSFLLPDTKVRLTSETIIDISHESIMTAWKRLKEWVSEETKSAQTYVRLSKSAELYQKGKTGLLVNPDLQLALKWREDNQPNEAWALRYDPAFARVISYIDYSKKEYEKAIAAKEEKQKRNLKRTRFIALFLGSASLISILFLIVAMNLKFKAENSELLALDKEKIAIYESKIAEEKRKEAISSQIVARQLKEISDQNRLLADRQKELAVKQQKEALYQKKLAVIAENTAIDARNIAMRLQKEAEELRDIAIYQKQIAEKQKNRAEYSEAKTDTLRRLSISKSLAIQSVKLYRNNKKMKFVTEEDKELPLLLSLHAYYFNKKYHGNPYDADIFSSLSVVSESKISLPENSNFNDAIRDIAISSNNEFFVSVSDDGKVNYYNFSRTNKPIKLKTSEHGKKGIRSVAISKDSKTIVAGTFEGDILVWNTTYLNETPIGFSEHESIISKIIFIENKKFISASNDGTVRLWNLENIENKSKIIYQIDEEISTLAINQSENRLAIATKERTISIINLETFKIEKEFITIKNNITALVWNNKNELNIGYQSGIIEIREPERTTKEIYAHSSGVTAMLLNRKTNQLITSSYDGTIKIWDNSNFNSVPIIINNYSSWVYSIVLTSDNRKLVCGSAKKIHIMEINIASLVSIIRKKVSKNMSEKNWFYYVGKDIEYSPNLPE